MTTESAATKNFANFYLLFPDISSFLVMDMQSVETTVVRDQNMLICHSLRCKQIDMLMADRLISIF